jgi:hypothetical protein
MNICHNQHHAPANPFESDIKYHSWYAPQSNKTNSKEISAEQKLITFDLVDGDTMFVPRASDPIHASQFFLFFFQEDKIFFLLMIIVPVLGILFKGSMSHYND